MTLNRIVLPGLILAGTLAAQTAPLQFEVASIRPSQPMTAATPVGVYIDGRQFRATAMAVRDYISIAYGLRIYQIEGPEWINGERFDINATLPQGMENAKVDGVDLPVMMKGLLEDRFKLRTHRISKEFPVYALVQLKEGIKAKESPLDETDGKSVTVAGTGGPQGTMISLGRGSGLSVGGNKIEAIKVSMLVLADTMARFVDRPVVDQTGLTSTYDIKLEVSPEDFQALMIRAAIAAGVNLPPQAMRVLDIASGDSLHEALAKVGLKLEPTKVPMDALVIDSVERMPSEN